MRRHEKEVVSREEIDAIIAQCLVLRLAMARGDEPYLVPLSFGYDGESFFFHTAETGRKLDFLAANDRVCFELDTDVALVRHAEKACRWTFTFQSVIGTGRVHEMTSDEEKTRGFDAIMRQYSGRSWEFEAAAMRGTRGWRIAVDSLTAKRSRPKDA